MLGPVQCSDPLLLPLTTGDEVSSRLQNGCGLNLEGHCKWLHFAIRFHQMLGLNSRVSLLWLAFERLTAYRLAFICHLDIAQGTSCSLFEVLLISCHSKCLFLWVCACCFMRVTLCLGGLDV
jgi:hypothetical protein